MNDVIEKPYCYGKTLPENISVKEIHHDFANIMQFLKENNIVPESVSDSVENLQKKYNKRVILHSQLQELVKFWNLSMCNTQQYVGEVPYYNQLELNDFIKEHNINIDKLMLVATPDTVIDEREMYETMRSIKTRRLEFEMATQEIRDELRKLQVKRDPIVLLETQSDFGLAYVIITAWGAEEKALWNLPSLS